MTRSDTLEKFWRRWDSLCSPPAAAQQPPFPEVKLRNDDVVIAGHAKTGTSWMMQIVHQIRSKGDMSFKDIYQVVPWIPFHIQLTADFDPDTPVQPWTPRAFKYHDTYEWRPGKDDVVRYIAIARDPFDAMWSMAKFAIPFIVGEDGELNDDEMLRLLQSPTFSDGCGYHDWLVSWFPHRSDPNVLLLHYEDLVEDLPTCVSAITDFMGVALSPNELATVVQHSSHEFMTKHREKFMADDGALTAMFTAMREEWKPTMGVVRPDGGKVGQGQKEIPLKVRKYLEDKWEATVGKALGFRNYADLRAVSSYLRCRK